MRSISESFQILRDEDLNQHSNNYIEHQKVEATWYRVSRVTGLDPAGPAFFPLNPYLTPLNLQDANFVDIIHTDSTLLGGKFPF